jgi:hypothetical protein
MIYISSFLTIYNFVPLAARDGRSSQKMQLLDTYMEWIAKKRIVRGEKK